MVRHTRRGCTILGDACKLRMGFVNIDVSEDSVYQVPDSHPFIVVLNPSVILSTSPVPEALSSVTV